MIDRSPSLLPPRATTPARRRPTSRRPRPRHPPAGGVVSCAGRKRRPVYGFEIREGEPLALGSSAGSRISDLESAPVPFSPSSRPSEEPGRPSRRNHQRGHLHGEPRVRRDRRRNPRPQASAPVPGAGGEGGIAPSERACRRGCRYAATGGDRPRVSESPRRSNRAHPWQTGCPGAGSSPPGRPCRSRNGGSRSRRASGCPRSADGASPRSRSARRGARNPNRRRNGYDGSKPPTSAWAAGAERHGRASQRVLHGHRAGRPRPRRTFGRDRPARRGRRPTAGPPCRPHPQPRPPRRPGRGVCRRAKADRWAARWPGRIRSSWWKIATRGVSRQGHATVPVAGEARSLGIDRDACAIAGHVADDRERVVLRAIVGDDQVEVVALREDARQRLGQVTGPLQVGMATVRSGLDLGDGSTACWRGYPRRITLNDRTDSPPVV